MTSTMIRSPIWVFSEDQLHAAVDAFVDDMTDSAEAAHEARDRIIDFLYAPDLAERGMRRGGEEDAG